jgi:hypothetical protein
MDAIRSEDQAKREKGLKILKNVSKQKNHCKKKTIKKITELKTLSSLKQDTNDKLIDNINDYTFVIHY